MTRMSHKGRAWAALALCGLLAAADVPARAAVPLRSGFASMSFGLNTYHNDACGLFGQSDMQASLSLGSRVFHAGGFRVGFTELHAANSLGVASFYESGEFAVFLEPLRLRGLSREEAPCDVRLFLGAGAVHRRAGMQQGGDNDFFGTMGASLSYRLFKGFSLGAEVSMRVYPSDFDNNATIREVLMASLSFLYDFDYRPFSSISYSESQYWDEDWYVGLAVGAGIWARASLPARLTPAMGTEAVVGKHLSTVWELRGRFALAQGRGEEPFAYDNVAVDVMANVANIFQERRNRPWNFSPYAGAGIIDNFADDSHFMFAVEGGLYLRRWLSRRSDLYLDLRGLLVPPRFSSTGSPLLFTAGVGYVYNLGRNTCR